MSGASWLRVLVVTSSAVAALAVGCSGGTDGEATDSTTTSTQTTTETEPGETTTPEETTSVRVYLVRGEHVGVVRREIAASPAVLRAALEELNRGPTAQEAEWGLTTAVPDGVEVLGVDLDGGTATIDLSGAFDDGGGSLSMFLRLGQLVHTATQFPTVQRVALRIDGQPVEVFSAEGIELPDTLTRADVEAQTPAILVETPAPGDAIGSPVTVAGTADTFEATLELELVAADGTRLASTFATATCGTGCRGTFSEPVAYETSAVGPATLRAFERSAEDGSETKVIEIPVVLG